MVDSDEPLTNRVESWVVSYIMRHYWFWAGTIFLDGT
jgi:hypothetical protein